MTDLEPEGDESSGDGAAWMATFADMMTLLLCFFILLLSFATMDIVKFRDAMGSVQDALGVQFLHEGEFEAIASSPLQLDEFEAASGLGEDRALLDELNAAISDEGLDDEIGAEIDGRGVVVRINGQVLYQQGDASLKAESDAILSRDCRHAVPGRPQCRRGPYRRGGLRGPAVGRTQRWTGKPRGKPPGRIRVYPRGASGR